MNIHPWLGVLAFAAWAGCGSAPGGFEVARQAVTKVDVCHLPDGAPVENVITIAESTVGLVKGGRA